MIATTRKINIDFVKHGQIILRYSSPQDEFKTNDPVVFENIKKRVASILFADLATDSLYEEFFYELLLNIHLETTIYGSAARTAYEFDFDFDF